MNSVPKEGPRREDGIYSCSVLEAFFGVLVDAIGPENCLHVFMPGYENYAVPSMVPTLSSLDIETDLINLQTAPRLALFDLPIGQSDSGGPFRGNSEFNATLKLISFLDDGGIALLTTGAVGLGRGQGKVFQQDLEKFGWKVLGYIELPRSHLNIGFQPLLAVLYKSDHHALFAASITDSTDEILVAQSLLECDYESWAESGFITKRDDFRGFHVERLRSELGALLNSESGFELYRLGDHILETSTHRRKEPFSIGGNDVAISRVIGGAKRDWVLAHDDEPNYKLEWIVITLDVGLLPAYFKMFMNSELGRKCLEVASDGSVHRFISVENLMDLQIPVPSLETQKALVATFENLVTLQAQILRLEKELVFNPKNADAVSSDVVSLLGSIGRLTVADEIKSLIRSGESKTTEFKETLSWDVRKEEKAKYIEQSALKTIAGFLNTNGGTLLVGVRDDGAIPGLSAEISKLHKGDTDRFLLHFKNLVKTKIGEKFYPRIDWSLESVDGIAVLVVRTERGSEPAFIDDVFYVRTNPATDQLQGERLYKYISEHFKLGVT